MVTKEILRCADKSLIAKVDMYEVQCDESMYQKHGIYAFDTGIIEAPLTKEEANLLASRYFYAGWEYVYYCHCTSEFNNMKPATRIVVSEVDVADKLVTEFGEVVFEYNPGDHNTPYVYYKSVNPISISFKDSAKTNISNKNKKSRYGKMVFNSFFKNHMILSIELIVFLCCLVIFTFFPSLWKDIAKVMVLMFTPLSILDIATNTYPKRKTAHRQ